MKTTYTCVICGHRYDPGKGDRLTGIDPGTRLEELPEDWRCPICRSDASAFQPESGTREASGAGEGGETNQQ